MPNTPPALVASGNIYPCRFVKISGDNTGAQAGANEAVIGVTRNETNYAPLNDPAISIAGYHAVSGEPIRMLGDGEIGHIEAGGVFSAGARLKSDTNGKAVAIATSGGALQNVGAIAMAEATAEGQLVRVQVLIGGEPAPA